MANISKGLIDSPLNVFDLLWQILNYSYGMFGNPLCNWKWGKNYPTQFQHWVAKHTIRANRIRQLNSECDSVPINLHLGIREYVQAALNTLSKLNNINEMQKGQKNCTPWLQYTRSPNYDHEEVTRFPVLVLSSRK